MTRMWHSDPVLLFPLPSQTLPTDRYWLATLFAHIRDRHHPYRYLEVGSYLGGTLTPALLDERCTKVLSIDLRPNVQPDARNAFIDYRHASTPAMLQTLRGHAEFDMSKLSTFDGLARDYDFGDDRYELAFIDAEHTDEAVFADFLSIYNHLTAGAAIAFHDSNLVTAGLENVLTFIRYARRTSWFAVLRGSSVSAILLDTPPEALPPILRDNVYDWQEYKTKSRDELLLEVVRNRCSFNVVLREKPVL